MSLVATDLAIGYPDHRIGQGYSLRLDPGRVVALLGPNGAGKSTLLKTLLGLLAPHAGTLTLEDRSLAHFSDRERARRLSYVPQSSTPGFGYRALEVVLMGRAAWHGALVPPSAADRRAAHDALARLGIDDLAQRPITRLSGGEIQLLLIARALAQAAPLMLLDEPTASLDFGHQNRVLTELARLKADGLGILFSTHDPNHAVRIADEVLLVSEGSPMAFGPVSQTLTAAALSRLYGCRVVDVGSDRPMFVAQ